VSESQTSEVTAYLAEVRIRAGFAAPGVFKGAAMESAADVPRLLAAVEAVLALTRDIQGELPGECDVSVGQVREAISCALLGEGDR
jgi:hypothetical protein